MSNFFVCAVFDSAVEAYGQPIFVRARGEAMRSFIDEVRRSDSMFAKHPSDYSLYLIGSFDDATASLVACTPERLVRGQDCLLKEE